MNKLRLPKLISDGMILQQKKKCHIWGYDVAGRQISIDFDGNTYSAVADLDGCFEVLLEAHESGGPYEMIVRDDADNKLVVHDVYYGEVFLRECSSL